MDYGKAVRRCEYKGVDKELISQLANAGFSDFAYLDISSSSYGDDISLADVFGSNKIFRAIKSCDASDGDIYIRTLNDYSEGYVPYPIKSGEKDVLLTPITHIRQSGSISAVIVFWQVIE